MQTEESKEHTDMITQENQWNEPFQDKNLERIWLSYPQDKTNSLKENWNFYKRFNPKSTTTSSSNLLTRQRTSSESTNSFSLGFAKHRLPRLWLWDPTQRFQITLVDLATTRFHQHLIVDLVPVDTCGFRRYKTSQISQE